MVYAIRDYNSIIMESALLTTVSGFLFGFLHNIENIDDKEIENTILQQIQLHHNSPNVRKHEKH